MDMHYIDTPKGKLTVKLEGEMDAAGCAKLRPCLDHLVHEHRHNSSVTLDMGQLKFLDSTGISVIVLLFKRLKAQGKTMEITQVQGQPGQLLELLRIGASIPIRPAQTAALAATETQQCAS